MECATSRNRTRRRIGRPRSSARDGPSPIHLSSESSGQSGAGFAIGPFSPAWAFRWFLCRQLGAGVHVGLSGTGFSERFMDTRPDVARESPRRGTRAAESDSLLTRATQSGNPGPVHHIRPRLRCGPPRPRRLRLRRSSCTGLWTATNAAGLNAVRIAPTHLP